MRSASAIAASAIASGVRDSVRIEPRVTGPPRTGSSWTRGSPHGASPAPARIEVPAAPARTDVPAAPALVRGVGADVVRSAAAAAASSAASMSSRVCWTGTSGAGCRRRDRGPGRVTCQGRSRGGCGCLCRLGRSRGLGCRGGRCRRRGARRLGIGARSQRVLVLPHRAEDGQAGRCGQGACGRVGSDDREPLLVRQRVAGQQAEVDPGRRHAGPVRQNDRRPATLDGPDARRRRRDLVVDVEVDDSAGHGQTFIARRTRRSAASSASSVVWSSIAW